MSKHESNKQTIIIYSGKKGDTFSKDMLDYAIKGLEERGRKYKIIDLYKEYFDPVYRSKDLALYSKGETTDKNALTYQKLIKNANELMFIYPTKWNGMDTMTKGFCDKVFLSNGFWITKRMIYFDALWGTMGWIKRVNVFTYENNKTKNSKNSGRYQMTLGTLFALHVKKRRMLRLKKLSVKSEEVKNIFLNKITKRSSKKI